MILYTKQLLNQLTELVKTTLPHFGLERGANVKLLTTSENATFVLGDKPQYIIRVYRPDYHSDVEIASELCWMQALKEQKSVWLPGIITTSNGGLFLKNDGWRLACFDYIEGFEPKPDRDLIVLFNQLGMIAAKLHKHVQTWQKPEHFTRKHWTYETMIGKYAIWGNWREAQGLTHDERALLEHCDRQLQQKEKLFPTTSEHFGLIHSDLRLANLIVNGSQIAAIDFDDCGFSWFGLDLANAISFIELDPMVPELVASWLKGYESQQLPTDTIRTLLSDLIMMRRLQLTAWLASHNETPTATELGVAYNKGTVELGKRWLAGLNFIE